MGIGSGAPEAEAGWTSWSFKEHSSQRWREEEVKTGLHSHQMLQHSEHSGISGTALKRGPQQRPFYSIAN